MVDLARYHGSFNWMRVQVYLPHLKCLRSVKWVGFLGMAIVGLYTAEDLWHKFGDVNMPVVFPFTVFI